VIKKKVKVNKVHTELLTLVPMLKSFAEESRTPKDRRKVHKIVKHNSTSKKASVNETLMNELWFYEMNVWDCIFRALEIKKNTETVKTGAYKLSPQDYLALKEKKNQQDDDEEEKAPEEQSGPLDDEDYKFIFDECK
jgi:hypothetical protein